MAKLVIWGTGSKAREILSRRFPEDAEIVAFIDSDPSRHGVFFDRPVVGPDAIASLDYDLLCIASFYHNEIVQTALEHGVDAKRIIPAWCIDLYVDNAAIDAEQIRILSATPVWYHKFEILPGVETPGSCRYKPWLLDFQELRDVDTKRVLDIGAWDGPYTLEMSRRGAQVTGFDIQPSDHCGFQTMCRLTGTKADHICSSVYDLSAANHGRYDVVLFFGVYYHLKNPLLAFENINRVLDIGGYMAFEGAVLEGAPKVDEAWRTKAPLLETMKNTPFAYYAKGDYEGEWSNWWVPNVACLKDWIESSGFEIVSVKRSEGETRAHGLARKVAELCDEHMVLPAPVGKTA